MSENKLYFVRADFGGYAEFACHLLAKSPSEAIEIGKAMVVKDGGVPSLYTWHARKSKSSPDQAMNAPKAPHD